MASLKDYTQHMREAVPHGYRLRIVGAPNRSQRIQIRRTSGLTARAEIAIDVWDHETSKYVSRSPEFVASTLDTEIRSIVAVDDEKEKKRREGAQKFQQMREERLQLLQKMRRQLLKANPSLEISEPTVESIYLTAIIHGAYMTIGRNRDGWSVELSADNVPTADAVEMVYKLSR